MNTTARWNCSRSIFHTSDFAIFSAQATLPMALNPVRIDFESIPLNGLECICDWTSSASCSVWWSAHIKSQKLSRFFPRHECSTHKWKTHCWWNGKHVYPAHNHFADLHSARTMTITQSRSDPTFEIAPFYVLSLQLLPQHFTDCTVNSVCVCVQRRLLGPYVEPIVVGFASNGHSFDPNPAHAHARLARSHFPLDYWVKCTSNISIKMLFNMWFPMNSMDQHSKSARTFALTHTFFLCCKI